MAEFQTQYQALESYYDDEDTEDTDAHSHEGDVMIHVVPEKSKARWNHIENLDEFFTRVYYYHQHQGFLCMVTEDVLQLLQFVFVVLFSAFLAKCVDYDVLFANVLYNTTHKVTLPEAVTPVGQCIHRFDFATVLCLLVAFVFWVFRVVKVIYNIFKYWEIKSFYTSALKISASDLPNLTWHEVQLRILEVQKEQQMCIHKTDLTQLDIYHRILRFKNYTIAMVNKSVLPLKFEVPFVGKYAFLSTGLKYNLEFLLFWGPWSAFENKWHLKDEYKEKSTHRRKQLAEYLSKKILWLGLANFALCPLIFLWQILYSFFRYAELVKRQPGFLGARKWSSYGRQYLRHFNELDHEFNARLNRGYSPANKYMNIFTSPFLTIIAKNIAFFAGSILAVLVVLTVVDEDVLSVEHVLTVMTIAGLIVTTCRVLIPDENAVYCPELLMTSILAQIHYIPEDWKGNAHTYRVRDEFSLLFQYKFVYLLEELFSPIITPFILCFSVRHRALEIVEFFHNFTVEVVGVGDVCSFAQMDIKKHGNPQWVDDTKTDANQYQQGEDGKIELSLMHFHLTNPEWRPPENCSMFINNVKEQAQRDLATLGSLHPDIPGPYQSLSAGLVPSGATGIGLGYTSLMSSIAAQSAMSPSVNLSGAPFASGTVHGHPRLRGNVSNCEGPLGGSGSGILSSMQNTSVQGSLGGQPSLNLHQVDEGTLEFMSTEMSFSALYMHDIRNRRTRGGFESLDDIRARAIWQRHDGSQLTPTAPTASPMPGIQEGSVEEESEKQGGAAEGGTNITKSV